MRLEDIKSAVESGQYVYWKHEGYQVIKDSVGQWLILCHLNGHCIGLTWQDGVTMNGDEWDFHIRPEQSIEHVVNASCYAINQLLIGDGFPALNADEFLELGELLESYFDRREA